MNEECGFAKLVKRVSLLAVIVCLLCLTTVACTRAVQFTDDLFLEQYDFLRYSLGDFELVSESVWVDTFPGERVSGRQWNLQFMRQDGTVEVFSFANGRSFGHTFASRVGTYGARQLEALADGYLANIRIIMYFQRENPHDFSRILDPETGLQLQSVTLSELADWGFTFRIVANSSERENYLDTIDDLKAATRTLAAYFMQEQVEVRFRLLSGDDISDVCTFVWYYEKQTDTFEIR